MRATSGLTDSSRIEADREIRQTVFVKLTDCEILIQFPGAGAQNTYEFPVGYGIRLTPVKEDRYHSTYQVQPAIVKLNDCHFAR